MPAGNRSQPPVNAPDGGPHGRSHGQRTARIAASWQAALPKLRSEAYFTNLNDGDTIETPCLLKFGLPGG